MSISPQDLRLAILFGGTLHFCVLIAAGLVPAVFDWRSELARLPKMLRQLIWVYGAFIALTIVGFGALSLGCANELASDSILGRSLCAFIGVFWAARLAVQFVLFDARPYLTNTLMKAGYHLLTLAFLLMTIVYLSAAFLPRVATTAS